MVQGKKQLNSKPKFADVVNTFRLYNRNKPSAEIAGGLHVYKTYTIPYRSFGHGHFRSKLKDNDKGTTILIILSSIPFIFK